MEVSSPAYLQIGPLREDLQIDSEQRFSAAGGLFRDNKTLLEQAGLPSIRFHDLRHTAASLMLNHNVPVIVVSRRLGHAKPSITLDIYGHLIPTVQNEVAEMLDEMVAPIGLVQTESV